ncbi:hypothetical protein BGL41_04545 [Fructilactobacillus sanfranciscensis]|uniref:helix-turn-helix domain-containing protein n=1 Tax=Fructilactobacillus sanfranciscensis TaxID=1625 RepID=UPI000CD3AB40|nr:XRE family transcriptional regulator [Fructilactobacillus sanfranciscensis]POH13395.1 hypothetical protein BGL41_04545 [Fructilactobacillus sanfranciscensis]
MAFRTEIKNIRLEKKFTLRQVALQSGIDAGYLSQLENGKRNIPKPATLEKLAKGLRISKEEIFKLAGLETPKPSNIEYIGSNFVNIPVIGEIACGEPIIAEENISDYVPIPSDVVENGTFFILNCIGDSMEPTISNGSQVVVREQPDAENGQIAAVLLEDENTATLKRIKKTKTNVILMPDNPSYDPIVLNEDRPGRILGIVKMEMKRF